MNTVAAIPDHLRRFAAAVAVERDHLHTEVSRLSHTLQHFSGRCREYDVPQLNGLSDHLFAHCRAIGELVEWVRSTADRIEAADRGALQRISFDHALTMTMTTLAVTQRWFPSPWSGLNIGARFALQTIWTLRRPIYSLTRNAVGLRAATWLMRSWVVQVAPPYQRWWLRLLWPDLPVAVAQTYWQVQLAWAVVLPWQPFPIALRIGYYIQTMQQVLAHLQSAADTVVTSLTTVGWLARFVPGIFGPMTPLLSPLASFGSPSPAVVAMVNQISSSIETIGQEGAQLVWQHWQQQTLHWLLPWILLLPNREQCWHTLNQSLVMSTGMTTVGVPPTVMFFLFGAQISALVGLVSASRLPEIVQYPAEALAIIESGFWIDAFHYLSNDEIRALAANLERIGAVALRGLPLSLLTRPAEGPDAEPNGQAAVTVVFPPADTVCDPTKPYQVTPAALQANNHGLISSYLGEEVRAAQIGQGVYAVGINGLNLTNMAYSTNGLVSVIETASGKERIAYNEYYQTVRERILRLIETLPSGSTLHLTGHSMGGGMCILLSNDPQVQAALAQRNIQLASVTTLGAVRPEGEWDDVPPVINGQSVIVRHYVDSDDKLALSVGAGHSDARYRDVVYTLENGRIDQPFNVHSDYDDLDYSQLPVVAQTLPFTIDPTQFRLIEIPTPPVDDWNWVHDPLWA